MDGHKAISVGQSNMGAHSKMTLAWSLSISDAPTQVHQFTDGDKWADDIEALIDELSSRCRDE